MSLPTFCKSPLATISRIMILFIATLIVGNCDTKPESKSGSTSTKTVQELFDLEKMRGKVLVVDFWATWCRPCISEIPDYNRIQKQYKDQPFVIVGLTMSSGTSEEVQPYLTKHNIEYTVAMGTPELAAQFGGIQAFPTTFVLDKDLKVVKKYVGGGHAKIADIEKLIPTLLN